MIFNKDYYRVMSIMLITCLVFASFSPEVCAAESRKQIRSVNSLNNSYEVDIEEANFGDTDGYHAIIDDNDNLKIENDEFVCGQYKDSRLPSYYSSKDYNLVTNIRNQRMYNLCWSYAAIGAVESACLSQGLYEGSLEKARENLDLSEKDFAYYFYNRKGHNDALGNTSGDYTQVTDTGVTWDMLGGNDMMAVWYMLNWEAPSNENNNDSETNPQVNPNFTEEMDFDSYFDCDYHIQNARFYKNNETDKIKEHIMKYGSVMVSYTAPSGSDVQRGKYIYNYEDSAPNHAVIIIGWDDTISKDKFQTTDNVMPSIDGGWLIKNSWGEKVGDDLKGYQWISYDDKTIGEFIGIDCEEKNNYDNIFYYDGAAGCDHTTITYKTTSYDTDFYNIFKNNTKYTQNIKAVGLAISDIGSDDGTPAECQIQIYKNPVHGTAQSGTAMLPYTLKKTFTENGYYTVNLNGDILIEPGEEFEVLFHFSTPTSLYVDQATSPQKRNWFSCYVGEEEGAGISYVNTTDMSTLNNRPTLRIKAYSNNIINLDDAQIEKVPDFVYDKTSHEPDIAVTIDGRKLIRNRDYKLTFTDSVNAGVVSYTIEGIGDCKGIRTGNFKINKRNIYIKAMDAKIPQGKIIDKYKYEITGLISGDDFKKGFEPTISCNATVSSNVGKYPIEVFADDDALGDNYIINLINGTLTIVDTDIDYIVKFDTAGKCNSPSDLLLNLGDKVIKPKNLNAEGYEFKGWYKDDKYQEEFDFENETICGYDITIFAKWEELKYNIIYKANYAEPVSEFEGINDLPYFDTYNVLHGELYERDGYLFTGWSQDPCDGEGRIKSGDIVTGKTFDIKENNETIILYAIWQYNKVSAPVVNIQSGIVEYGTGISLSSETDGASIYYVEIPMNASEENKKSIPDKKSKVYTEEIRIKEDTIIKAVAVKDGCRDSDIVSFEYTIKLDQGEIEDDDLDKYCDEGIPNKVWIAGGASETDLPLVYDGKKKTFDINVYDYNKKLIPGKDYKVSFRNNKNACEDINAAHAPTVIVKGKGNYKGTLSMNFIIEKKSIEQTDDNSKPIYCCYENASFLGKKFSMDIYAQSGKKLKLGKEYTCKFYTDEKCINEVSPTEEGVYYAKLEGIGNYKGSRVVKHHVITSGNLMKDSKVKGISKSFDYDDGNEVSQNKLYVSHKKIGELIENKDFEARYFNNTEVGTAKVILTALPSDKNLYGSKCISYKIKGIPMSKCKIEKFWVKEDPDDEYPFIYEGDEITVDTEISVKDKDGEITDLVEDVDYTVSYKNNVKPGKATVYIKGIGKYYGTVSRSFSIKKADIKDFSVEYSKEVEYEKNGAEPNIKVANGSEVLKKDVDYTVVYKNNKEITGETSSKKPSFIIKGKGNYCGVIGKDRASLLTFSIIKRNMGTTNIPIEVEAEDVIEGENIMITPRVFDKDRSELKMGIDYSAIVCYYLAETNEPLNENKALPKGTVINVVVSGMGSYEGKAIGSYRIVEKTLEYADVTIENSHVYDRAGTKVEVDDIIVELDGVKLTPGKDYEVKSCYNNTKLGKAIVIIHGIGKYGGTKKCTYIIDKKDLGTNI